MKLPKDLDKVCYVAPCYWSTQAQTDVAVGEIGELLALIGKQAQGRATADQWADEITDVIIMCHQLAVIHCGIPAVEKRLKEKVKKLKQRLEVK